MGLHPTPVVTIDGAAPAMSNGDLLVLDDLAVTWGTHDPIEQPPPSTARLEFLDYTSRWATERDVIGLPVTLGWTLGADSRVFFRGRITGVELTRTVTRDAHGQRRPAVRIAATCTSIETDLANRFPTDTDWPAETLGARADRIGRLLGSVAHRMTVREFWRAPQVAAVDGVNGTSVRDLLTQLYNSTGGDRLVYSPHTQTYEWNGRRARDYRGLLRLVRGAGDHPRAGTGYWAAPTYAPPATGVDLTTAGSLYLDAAQLEYDDGLSRDTSSRITRVQVTSADAAAADAQVTTVRTAPGVDERIIGQRALTLDSVHNLNSWAELNAEDLLALATQEGGLWRPGRVRWRPGRHGGFDTAGQLAALLRGHVTGWMLVVARSWLPTVGIRPVFSVIGGVIGYRDGGWVIDMDLAGWASVGGGNATPFKVKQHPVSWQELDGVVWSATPGPDTFHESVTYGDLRYISRGPGDTTEGPDTGWDFYL